MDTKLTKIKYNSFLKVLICTLTAILLLLGGQRVFFFSKALILYEIPAHDAYYETSVFDKLLMSDISIIKHYVNYANLDEQDIKNLIREQIESERQKTHEHFKPIDWLQKNQPTLFWIEEFGLYVDREEYENYQENKEEFLHEQEEQTEEVYTEEIYDEINNQNTNEFADEFQDAIYDIHWKIYMEEAVNTFINNTDPYFTDKTDSLSTELIDNYYNEKLNKPHIMQDEIASKAEAAIDYAKENRNLKFAVYNKKNGRIYSNFASKNTAIESLTKHIREYGEWYLYYSQETGTHYSSSELNAYKSERMISNDSDHIYYIYMPKTLTAEDMYLKLQTDFNNLNDNFQSLFNSAFIFLALAAAFGIYLLVMAGRKSDGSLALLPTDKLYNDLHFLISFCLAGAMLLFCFFVIKESRFYLETDIINKDSFLYNILKNGFIIVFTLAWMIVLEFLISASRNLKNKRLIKHTLFYAVFSKIKWAFRSLKEIIFDNKMVNIKKTSILALIFYLGINGFLILIALLASITARSIILFFFTSMLVAMFNFAVLLFLMKSIQSLDSIMTAARSIRSGNLHTYLNMARISVWLRPFAKDILDNQEGLKNAVADATKNERMKAELITNVSHDLKTPLTSIVSYVSLLKKCEIKNEDAQKYIHVLDEKAERLKRLIEDLVEASKASTGSLSINPIKIDLYELALQAIGENNDDLESKGIDCLINNKTENAIIFADNQRTWRIIDNLFSNAKKYTMPGTRIYIDIEVKGAYGVFTMKNISKEALNVPAEELTQRFVRGDESRGGDGSGLGLSIAKSLCELQGGNFDIQIDGDLFKAIIGLPLAK